MHGFMWLWITEQWGERRCGGGGGGGGGGGTGQSAHCRRFILNVFWTM